MEEDGSSEKERGPAVEGGWVRALLLLLSFLFLTQIMGIIAVGVIKAITGLPVTSIGTALSSGAYPRLLLIHQSLAAIGTLVLVQVFRTKVDRKDLSSLGLRFRFSPFLKGLLLGPLVMGACALILYLLGSLGFRWNEVRGELLLIYFLLTLAIAFKEELLFRGYLLNNLMSSMNRYWALLVTAIAFLGLHVFNPGITWIAVLNLFLAGLLLGVSYIHDQQLAFPIGLHLGWNFAQGPLFNFKVSGLTLDKGSLLQTWTQGADIKEAPSYLSGGEFGLEGSLLLSGFQILLIPVIHMIWKKYNDPKRGTLGSDA